MAGQRLQYPITDLIKLWRKILVEMMEDRFFAEEDHEHHEFACVVLQAKRVLNCDLQIVLGKFKLACIMLTLHFLGYFKFFLLYYKKKTLYDAIFRVLIWFLVSSIYLNL